MLKERKKGKKNKRGRNVNRWA